MGQIVWVEVPISIPSNAHEWQLYSAMEGAERVAQVLSIRLATCINRATEKIKDGRDPEGAIRAELIADMYPMMREYKDFGTVDSEPIWEVESVIEKFVRAHGRDNGS